MIVYIGLFIILMFKFWHDCFGYTGKIDYTLFCYNLLIVTRTHIKYLISLKWGSNIIIIFIFDSGSIYTFLLSIL